MLSVLFECNFQKIAKINSLQEKPVSSFLNRKKLVPAKLKKSPIRKIKLLVCNYTVWGDKNIVTNKADSAELGYIKSPHIQQAWKE